nr:MAG TPA: hypothetical protein [Caudoviricetes sp.]
MSLSLVVRLVRLLLVQQRWRRWPAPPWVPSCWVSMGSRKPPKGSRNRSMA